jgi:Ca2+-binding EF-hand superfamily protein
MLKAQGHELEEDELKMVMSHLDADGDGDTLSFEEFMTVMNDLEHGAGLADIASHFSSEMTSLVGLAAVMFNHRPYIYITL